jgi:osmotically-inducible protein OsmY
MISFLRRISPSSLRALPVAFALAAPVACQQADAPEARLEDAAENFQEAREETKEKHEDVQAIRDEIAKKYAEVENAEKELADARQELAKAEQQLQEARARLDTRATDVALFRSIQKSLLDEDGLRHSAIRVEVDDRVVTLRGQASDKDAHQRAVDLAKAAPGTERIVDHITVEEQRVQRRKDGSDTTSKSTSVQGAM